MFPNKQLDFKIVLSGQEWFTGEVSWFFHFSQSKENPNTLIILSFLALFFYVTVANLFLCSKNLHL